MTMTLDQAPLGVAWRVAGVRAPVDAGEWAHWLRELGFLPGERVAVLVRAVPGGDPLVTRIGTSTYALRRAEAACIDVEPLE
jgi:ferrous iron transport protein A